LQNILQRPPTRRLLSLLLPQTQVGAAADGPLTACLCTSYLCSVQNSLRRPHTHRLLSLLHLQSQVHLSAAYWLLLSAFCLPLVLFTDALCRQACDAPSTPTPACCCPCCCHPPPISCICPKTVYVEDKTATESQPKANSICCTHCKVYTSFAAERQPTAKTWCRTRCTV